ncbi:protein of unknown function [Mycoplasma capricolum subsp. capripneumoniae]|nr:hypothetical protein M1601_00845 [Mycoplasma capricolum subsp. capripneumoniae M1601]CDZ17980.1 protein of unknown function [Mycoplasma capricolum subsp. capripneumoniae]
MHIKHTFSFLEYNKSNKKIEFFYFFINFEKYFDTIKKYINKFCSGFNSAIFLVNKLIWLTYFAF